MFFFLFLPMLALLSIPAFVFLHYLYIEEHYIWLGILSVVWLFFFGVAVALVADGFDFDSYYPEPGPAIFLVILESAIASVLLHIVLPKYTSIAEYYQALYAAIIS